MTPTVLGMGELLWDCGPTGRHPGGAPANLVATVCQLGGRGDLLARVGQDADGEELLERLAAHGIPVEGIQRDATLATGITRLAVTAGGRVSWDIQSPAAWDRLAWDDRTLERVQQADAVCFGSLGMRQDVARQTLLKAAAAATDTLVVFDVNLRQSFYTPDRLRDACQLAHVVKLNEQEAQVLPALLEFAPIEEAALAAQLQDRFHVQVVCVTHGARGATLYDGSQVETILAPVVTEVDPVGAGDAFTAAFVMARLLEHDLRAAGELATAVGAWVAARPGAMPEADEELGQLRRRLWREDS